MGIATEERIGVEWLKCQDSFAYFVHEYCHIYDATLKQWIPFKLWPAQAEVADAILSHMLLVILKARQLGMTWLVLAFALWLCLFQPAATVLMFSKRDDEAMYLLGIERLKGMFLRLPSFLKPRSVLVDNEHEWMLSNGSVVRAFPTNAGDSYTATLAIVDEADLVPDLGELMTRVKPTIDAGGRMILLSRVDKAKPESEFKKIYLAAKARLNNWKSIFLAWRARPDRTQAWYDAQTRDTLANTGSLDDVYEQYPATDEEALSPKSLDKRIAPAWLRQCFVEGAPIHPRKAPAIPGLLLFAEPRQGGVYVIGADPAEGNPTSDDSAFTVLDADTAEEAATLAGKFQPAVFAAHIHAVGTYFNNADVLVERNNHGHAVILWLNDNSWLALLPGLDGKDGWQTNTKSKAILYDDGADAFRERKTIVHSRSTFTQLQSIEGSSLSAPEGQRDDLAISCVLALKARTSPRHEVAHGPSPLKGYRG